MVERQLTADKLFSVLLSVLHALGLGLSRGRYKG